MEPVSRVGLDVWPATTHAPGVGRYARELVRSLAGLDPAPRMRLLDVGPGPRTLELGPLPAGWSRVQAELPRGALRLLAGLGLGAETLAGGCDLFHRVLPGEPALGNLPRVQALAELPARASAAEGALRRALAGPCDVVVFSAAARGEVLERYRLEAERVHALPVGCDHWLRDAAPRDELAGAPLVLALGRTDHARGPLALLSAVERLGARGRPARLVWCGRAGDAAPSLRSALARSPLGARARWIEPPGEQHLARLVADAAVLVHLRREEWTPVTLLEGAACGAALLASPLEAYGEVLEGEVHWLPGDPAAVDPTALGARLAEALDDGVRPERRRHRRARAREFTWSRHARRSVELWERILAR